MEAKPEKLSEKRMEYIKEWTEIFHKMKLHRETRGLLSELLSHIAAQGAEIKELESTIRVRDMTIESLNNVAEKIAEDANMEIAVLRRALTLAVKSAGSEGNGMAEAHWRDQARAKIEGEGKDGSKKTE